jgi:hypothetical protein
MIRSAVRRYAVPAGLCLALVAPATAQGAVQPVVKWRDCATTSSGIQVRSEYTVQPTIEGKGTYYIRVDIRWDLNKLGMWRRMDNRVVESSKFTVRSEAYTHWFKPGDRTVWYKAYRKPWRAHVISKLMKVRTGPDKTVYTEDRYYSRAVFAERSPSMCDGVEF